MVLLELLHRVAAREELSRADARAAADAILSGEESTPRIAAFLSALKTRGETAEELTGFAESLRSHMTRIDAGEVVDSCGTGGDGASTFNISTAVALVAAGAGLRVAKHGNRSFSSRSGSADVLEALGVKVDQRPDRTAAILREVGVAFLFAPLYHPALKHAQSARAELKMRTIFNLLGPLVNPAGARVQLIGAPSEALARLMAEALAALGTGRSLVVHGAGGLDEISLAGVTQGWEVRGHEFAPRVVDPQEAGLAQSPVEALAGGGPAENAALIREVLHGALGPRRDVVLLNAGALLELAGRAATLAEGVAQAAKAIDSGAALGRLEALATA
jgi:anthranilate phosphoribosyltransferase